MTKLHAGDRCEVWRHQYLDWGPATVITVYPGHCCVLALVDSADSPQWFKTNECRPKPAPAPDPHGTAYQGEVGDHPQTHRTATVEITPNIRPLKLAPKPHHDEPLHLITAMYRGAW